MSSATNSRNHSPSKQVQIVSQHLKAYLLPHRQNQNLTPFNAVEAEVNRRENDYHRIQLVRQTMSVPNEHSWILFATKTIDLKSRCAVQNRWEEEVEMETLDLRWVDPYHVEMSTVGGNMMTTGRIFTGYMMITTTTNLKDRSLLAALFNEAYHEVGPDHSQEVAEVLKMRMTTEIDTRKAKTTNLRWSLPSALR